MATKQPTKKTALLTRLTEEHKTKLAEMCVTRVGSLQGAMSEMHRKRDNYLLQMEDEFDYRKTLGEQDTEKPTAIFAKQNDSINIIGGLSEFLSARTIDDLLGSQPFFSLTPEGRSDVDLSRTMQRHAEWRIRRSNLESVFSEAIATAYGIGETPVKIIYDQKMLYSERAAKILIDPKTRKFVVTPDGDYIFDTDQIIEAQEAPAMKAQEPGPDPEIEQIDAMVEAETQPEKTVVFAEKAPGFDLSPFVPFQFVEAYVDDDQPVGEAIQGITIHHRDFLCPPTARSIEDADFVAHLADYPLSEAKRKWDLDEETLAIIRNETKAPKSDSGKAQQESDEAEETIPYEQDMEDPLVQFAECYTTTLIKGRQVRLLCIVCIKAKTIVYADYLANVTPNGNLPFFIVRPFPKKNRWYGRGFFEIYSYAQEFIERHLNYIAYRNRHHANPTRLVKTDLLKNIAEGDEVPVNPDTTLYVEKSATPSEAITFIEYPDLDSRTWELMQMMIQIVQLRSGVTSAAQGGVESLPQNSTATGIEAILNSGNVLSRRPIREIKRTLEQALFYSMKLIYTNLNEKEAFTYLEGEEAKLLSLSRDQIAGLDFNVRMTMTRFRERESRENAQNAIGAFMQYLQIPEEEKAGARPLFVDVIRSWGQQDAERIIRQPLPPPDPATLPPPAV